jgi:hypothetical protein
MAAVVSVKPAPVSLKIIFKEVKSETLTVNMLIIRISCISSAENKQSNDKDSLQSVS